MTGRDAFASRRSTVRASRGMVATSQPLASEAGLEVLRAGGNAFDAAVATAATLNVVEPTSTGLGGDVFALYRTADGDVGAMRACGGAPQDATIENVRESVANADPETVEDWYPDDGGYAVDDVSDAEMPFYGPHSVTVPGTARGWEATVEAHGRLSLADVLEPAIHYATAGYPVSDVIATYWQGADALFDDAHAREAYLFDDEPPTPGQHVTMPKLGASLERIAGAGADVVYEGEIATEIVDAVQAKGGFLTERDLEGFEVEWPDPISTTYNGVEVFELPPNNQGLIALEALNVAEVIDAGEYDYDSVERVHAFAEATKLAFHDGHRYITDPNYESVPDLAAKEYARRRAEAIGDTANHDVSFGMPNGRAEDADTVLLTVADDDGNVVSFINSRFAGFGSGLVAGDSGIALQNRGASFSLDPSHPNALEPGKRPFHTLVPAVARFDVDDWAAFGVMGGYMQPQGHVQVLSNLVDYDMDLQEALDAPRWRYREDDTLGVEERLGPAGIQTALARKTHDVSVLPPVRFGGAQIVRNQRGTLSGATEPRKDGTVAGY